MNKWLSRILVSLLLLTLIVLPVSARNAEILDAAALLSPQEEAELTQRLANFEQRHSLTVVLLTVPDLMDQPISNFADNYYENNRYSEDGLLFLLDMGSRQWYISTSGAAIEALSDRDLVRIEDTVIPYFSQGQYAAGFTRFLEILPGYLPVETESGAGFGIPLLIGAGVAALVLMFLRGRMNTMRSQHSAADYEVSGSYQLRRHQDLFLYSNVSKQAKPQNNSSGSSTHRSASGRSHGGRGGKF